MSPDIASRIERLLDQLENPELDQIEIDKIKTKVEYLKAQQS